MKSVKFILGTIIPPIIGFALIYFSFSQFSAEQIQEIKSQFKFADYTYLVISLFFALVAYYSRAYRWLIQLEHLGYKSSFQNSFVAICISYLINLTIPRSGEISRAGVLNKTDNIPFQIGFGTIVSERIIDLLILLFITLIAFLIEFEIIITFIADSNFSVIKLLFTISGLLIILFAVFLIFRFSNHQIILSIKEKVLHFKDIVQSVLFIKRKKAFIFHTLIIWGSYLIMFSITFFMFPETSNLEPKVILVAFVAGSFAVTLTNGGIGAYPLIIAKTLLFYGVSETIGTALGWIVWSSQIAFILILGCSAFLVFPFLKKQIIKT